MCRRHLAWPVFPTHGGRTGERSQHSEMNSLLRRCQARAYTTHLKRRDKGREGHVSQLRKYETEHGPVASGLAGTPPWGAKRPQNRRVRYIRHNRDYGFTTAAQPNAAVRRPDKPARHIRASVPAPISAPLHLCTSAYRIRSVIRSKPSITYAVTCAASVNSISYNKESATDCLDIPTHIACASVDTPNLVAPTWSRLRIPRHPDTQSTNIRTLVPRSFGQAVGAQRRRFA